MLSRNKTFSIGVALSFFITSLGVGPAQAIYEGTDASNENLVSVVHMNMGCSAAPIAKRLLVMAQHCPAVPNQTRYTYPGEPFDSPNTVTALKSFVPKGEFKGGREYDIMIVVVDKDLPVSDNIIVANKEDVDTFINNKNNITIYGFGLTELGTRPSTAKKGTFKIYGGQDLGNGISDSYKSYLSTTPVNGRQEVCNGDSGGPAYVFDSEKIYYIGAVISSNKVLGCGTSQHIAPIARVQTLYPFIDLVDEAKNWVLQNIKEPAIIVKDNPVVVLPKEETSTVGAVVVEKPKKVVSKKVTPKKKIVKKKK